MDLIEYRGNYYTIDDFNDYAKDFLSDWAETASTNEIMEVLGASYATNYDAVQNDELNRADDDYGM